MSYTVRRALYIAFGVTWCLVGGQVVIGGITMIKSGGKK